MESLIKFSRTVVITGTSSGIGRGLCKSFVKRGYNVFGTVRNKKDAYEAEHQFDGGEINGSTIKINIV